MKELTPIDSRNSNAQREPRIGVMLHYFGSRTDAGALSWATDPRWKASYHILVFDNGDWVRLVDLDRRAWHAGECKPSKRIVAAGRNYNDANSAFFGLCAACGPDDAATSEQVESMGKLIRMLYAREGWEKGQTQRVTTHSAEAWPRGRKIDPHGPPDGKHYPVFTRSQVLKAAGMV